MCLPDAASGLPPSAAISMDRRSAGWQTRRWHSRTHPNICRPTMTHCSDFIISSPICAFWTLRRSKVCHSCLARIFMERLTGTVRREYLDRVLFRNASDLKRKLREYRNYCNGQRVHASLDGRTPDQISTGASHIPAQPDRFAWISHCRGLFHAPVAA